MNARLGALLGALLISAGCGQKGALYLPDPVPQAVPAPPPAGATPAAPAAPAAPTDDEATRRKTPATPDPASAR